MVQIAIFRGRWVLVAVLAGCLAGSLSSGLNVFDARAACAPEDKVNDSTAQWAQQQAEQAGYTNVRMDRKGCDNFWHGTGQKNGTPVFLVVTPDGRVIEEGN